MRSDYLMIRLRLRPILNCPNNVFIRSWLPQNEFLGHPKVKLFKTHCGFKSYIESAYHGTPMIGFPIFMDQIGYCANMQGKGLGLTMDITTFTPKELADNMQSVMKNEAYANKAQHFSSLMHTTQPTSKQRVVFWMEHVVQFGADQLRFVALDMNRSIFQFFMIDVIAALFFMYVLSTLIVSWCCLRVNRLFRKRHLPSKIKCD